MRDEVVIKVTSFEQRKFDLIVERYLTDSH